MHITNLGAPVQVKGLNGAACSGHFDMQGVSRAPRYAGSTRQRQHLVGLTTPAELLLPL